MGLILNGYRNGFSPFVYRCGALTTIYNPSCMPRNQGATGMTRGFMYQSGLYASLPEGCRHPHVWMMPQKAGRMASRNNTTGTGTLSADGWAVRLGEADLTGDGGITSALGGLIVQLIAAITGSGTVTNGDVKAFLAAVASLTGTGEVSSAAATGLGALLAALTGDGTANGSTATGIGQLDADIVAYGDLTPEGLRDAVWNALLSNYTTAGSAGLALQTAGSGGVDYDALWASMPTALKESLAEYVRLAALADPFSANVKEVNDVVVDGTGAEGDEWGPV